MAESLYYFLPGSRERAGRYALNALVLVMAAGLGCALAAPLFGPKLALLISNPGLAQHMGLLGLYLFLMLSTSTLEIVMIARGRYILASFSYAFFDLARAAAFIVPALLFPTLRWLLLGAVGFAALRLCAAAGYLWSEFAGEMAFDRTLLKEQLHYALPFGLSIPFAVLQTNYHQYAVSYAFDPATFAIYAVGCLQIPLIEFLAIPVGAVMMVRMTEKLRDGHGEQVVALWHDTTRKLALVFVPLVGLLLIVADDLIALLFTTNYLASVPIFRIWSLVFLFSILQTDGVIRVYANTRFAFWLSVLRFGLTVGLIHVFMTVFGLVGAVLVALFVLGLDKALALARIRRLTAVSLGRLLPWKNLAMILAVSMAAALGSFALKAELAMSGVAALIIAGGSYALLYGFLVMRMGILDEDEKQALLRWFGKVGAGAAKTVLARGR
jgi:O-antigen/teichoic acid export membrane protein